MSVTFKEVVSNPAILEYAEANALDIAPWGYESETHWRPIFGQYEEASEVDGLPRVFIEAPRGPLVVRKEDGLFEWLSDDDAAERLAASLWRPYGPWPSEVSHVWIFGAPLAAPDTSEESPVISDGHDSWRVPQFA